MRIPLPSFGEEGKGSSCDTSGPLSLSQSSSYDCTYSLRIDPEKLASLLSNPMSHSYEMVIVIDVRFEYEYIGGHIIGSKNITNIKGLKDLFNMYQRRNICLVFHCEFSQDRGPEMLSFFRNLDRVKNLTNYPTLSYPNIFLLNGGFRDFHQKYPELCIGSYTPMRDENHVKNGDLYRSHSSFREDLKSSQGMPRRMVRCSSGSSQIPNSFLSESRSGFLFSSNSNLSPKI